MWSVFSANLFGWIEQLWSRLWKISFCFVDYVRPFTVTFDLCAMLKWSSELVHQGGCNDAVLLSDMTGPLAIHSIKADTDSVCWLVSYLNDLSFSAPSHYTSTAIKMVSLLELSYVNRLFYQLSLQYHL